MFKKLSAAVRRVLKAKKAKNENAFNRHLTLGLESLESREMLSGTPWDAPVPRAPQAPIAIVSTPHVWDSTVNTQWSDNAIGAEENLMALQPWTNLKAMVYKINGERGNVETGTLKADLMNQDGEWGKPDGHFETTVATDSGLDNRLVFRSRGWGFPVPQNGLPLQVELTFTEGASPGEYQLSEPRMRLNSAFGRPKVHQFGYDNPVITVQQSAELNVGIDGPSSQFLFEGQNNVNVANVVLDASEDIDVYVLPVLLEANDAIGNPIDLGSFVEDVELRNVATGFTVDATSQDHGVYTFDGFTAPEGLSKWEVQVDLVGGDDGDRIRASVLDGVEHNGHYYGIYGQQQDRGGSVQTNPGGMISGNYHTVDVSNLTIVEKGLNSSDVAVENQRDIVLGRFEARADGGQDQLLTYVAYATEEGSPLNLVNGSIWVDTDANGRVDTILEDGNSAQNNQFTFSDLAGGGYVVPADTSVVFEFHADVASSLSLDNTYRGRLSHVEVEILDNGASANWSIDHTPQTLFSFVPQGDLFVTKDSVPVRSHQYLGGKLGEAALRIEARGENEPIDVTDLRFTTPDGVDPTSVDRLELFRDGESQPFVFATRAGAAGTDAIFAANMENRQLVIPEGQDFDILVRPRIKADIQGGVNGQEFALMVHSVEARGDFSSNNLLQNDGDSVAEGEVFVGVDQPGPNQQIDGNLNTVVMAKVASITNANPDPNGTQVPVGVSDVGQFKLSAASHNNNQNGLDDVEFEAIAFNVNSTNVEIETDSVKLHNKADQTVQATATLYTPDGQLITTPTYTGSFIAVFDSLRASSVNTGIDQGSDETFVVQMNIVNPVVNPTSTSTLQVSLQNFTERDDDGFGIGDDESHVLLAAVDSAFADDTFFDWLEFPETTVRSTSYIS